MMKCRSLGVFLGTVAVLILLLQGGAFAQGSAGTSAKAEPRFIVDMPTAGMLAKGSFALDVDFFQEGGVLVALSAGIFERLGFGISYGGSHLLGSGSPMMNELPGVSLRFRLLEESIALPAIAFGFDSQGKDGFIKGLNRYTIKSPGLYVAASKNYLLLGFFSIHGGLNYSLERADGDRSFNLFAGVEKTVGPFLSLLAEYNLAANDNGGDAIGKGQGYLNLALKCTLGGGLTIGVNFKDLLNNGEDVTVASRTVRIEFIGRL